MLGTAERVERLVLCGVRRSITVASAMQVSGPLRDFSNDAIFVNGTNVIRRALKDARGRPPQVRGTALVSAALRCIDHLAPGEIEWSYDRAWSRQLGRARISDCCGRTSATSCNQELGSSHAALLFRRGFHLAAMTPVAKGVAVALTAEC